MCFWTDCHPKEQILKSQNQVRERERAALQPSPHSRSHFKTSESKAALVSAGCHIKYHRVGALNNKKLISQKFVYFGGKKAKIKVATDAISIEICLPGFQTVAFSLCPHTAFLCGPGKRHTSYINKHGWQPLRFHLFSNAIHGSLI